MFYVHDCWCTKTLLYRRLAQKCSNIEVHECVHTGVIQIQDKYIDLIPVCVVLCCFVNVCML